MKKYINNYKNNKYTFKKKLYKKNIRWKRRDNIRFGQQRKLTIIVNSIRSHWWAILSPEVKIWKKILHIKIFFKCMINLHDYLWKIPYLMTNRFYYRRLKFIKLLDFGLAFDTLFRRKLSKYTYNKVGFKFFNNYVHNKNKNDKNKNDKNQKDENFIYNFSFILDKFIHLNNISEFKGNLEELFIKENQKFNLSNEFDFNLKYIFSDEFFNPMKSILKQKNYFNITDDVPKKNNELEEDDDFEVNNKLEREWLLFSNEIFDYYKNKDSIYKNNYINNLLFSNNKLSKYPIFFKHFFKKLYFDHKGTYDFSPFSNLDDLKYLRLEKSYCDYKYSIGIPFLDYFIYVNNKNNHIIKKNSDLYIKKKRQYVYSLSFKNMLMHLSRNYHFRNINLLRSNYYKYIFYLSLYKKLRRTKVRPVLKKYFSFYRYLEENKFVFKYEYIKKAKDINNAISNKIFNKFYKNLNKGYLRKKMFLFEIYNKLRLFREENYFWDEKYIDDNLNNFNYKHSLKNVKQYINDLYCKVIRPRSGIKWIYFKKYMKVKRKPKDRFLRIFKKYFIRLTRNKHLNIPLKFKIKIGFTLKKVGKKKNYFLSFLTKFGSNKFRIFFIMIKLIEILNYDIYISRFYNLFLSYHKDPSFINEIMEFIFNNIKKERANIYEFIDSNLLYRARDEKLNLFYQHPHANFVSEFRISEKNLELFNQIFELDIIKEIKTFFNSFIKRGGKNKIRRIIFDIIDIMKLLYNNKFNFYFYFKFLFFKIKPVLLFKRFHVGKKLHFIPFFQNDTLSKHWEFKRRIRRIAISWIVKAIQMRKEKTLILRIINETLDIFSNKGETIKFKRDFYLQFYNSQSYKRLLRFTKWI